MTTRRRHSQLAPTGHPKRARTLSFIRAMVVSAPAFLASSIPATASEIMYKITPATGATASFPPFGTLTITGDFGFDPEPETGPGTQGPHLVSADITAFAAPQSVLIQGMAENFDMPRGSDASSIAAKSSATSDEIKIDFAAPLGISPDDIAEVMVFNHNTGFTISSSPPGSATGQADPGFLTGAGAPIPEPASLTLLGGALGLFLLTRRTNRRVRRP
jgi:hypothetical protein